MKLIVHNNKLSQASKQQRREMGARRDFTLILEDIPECGVASLNLLASHLVSGVTLPIKVGLATVHPEDQFCRKVGLNLAESRKKVTRIKVVKISAIEMENRLTTHRVVVSTEDGSILALDYSFHKRYPVLTYFDNRARSIVYYTE